MGKERRRPGPAGENPGAPRGKGAGTRGGNTPMMTKRGGGPEPFLAPRGNRKNPTPRGFPGGGARQDNPPERGAMMGGGRRRAGGGRPKNPPGGEGGF